MTPLICAVLYAGLVPFVTTPKVAAAPAPPATVVVKVGDSSLQSTALESQSDPTPHCSPQQKAHLVL